MNYDFIVNNIYFLKFIKIIMILILVIYFSRFLKRCFKVCFKNKQFKKNLSGLYCQLVNIFCWSVGVVTILGTLDVNISALLAGLGLTGFAVGFACKDVLSNSLSGFIIMLYSPFEIGDVITIKGKVGKFDSINFRYVKLISNSGEIVLIPNSSILNEIILVNDSVK
jgi:small-conductance mechanosensitive channel